VKSEQILTKCGPLKELSVRRVVWAFYLVVVEYKENLRIYYYSRDGELLEAQNSEKDPKLIHNIKKSTIQEFHID